MSNKWVVQVEVDEKSGEMVVPLPTDLLSQMGWHEGTDLFWVDNHNGSWTVTDKAPTDTNLTEIDQDVGC